MPEREERKMKTLYAKKALTVGLVFSALVCIPSALSAAYFFGTGKPGGGILYIIILLFGGYAGVYKGVKIYRTHWIKYGGGKVIIRRISKDRENGGTGKMDFCLKK